MPELRKDYFTNKFVITNSERLKRPSDFRRTPKTSIDKKCFICSNFNRPGQVGILESRGGLVAEKRSESNKEDEFFKHIPAFGYHYIISESSHELRFDKLAVPRLSEMLISLQEKGRSLYSKKGIEYISIYLDYGIEEGTGTSHPAFELLTLPEIPPIIAEELNAVNRSMYDLGICPMCRVLSVETGGPRQILSTTHFLAFAPWAATHSFEFWICPKAHQTTFLRISESDIYDLALILRSTLGGLVSALGRVQFNLVFHNSPQEKSNGDLHWHIEVYPQIKRWAGMETGMNIFINDVSPEDCAELLGKATRKQLADLVGVT